MSLLNIVYYPDDPLTKAAEPITEFGASLAKLADSMMETMVTAEGIGLAGPQVGLSKRIFIASDGEMDPRPFINPEIIDLRGQEMGEEGCLSLPELYAPVSRAKRIKVRAQDPKGKTFEMKTDGLLARCIQHEYDHLEGVCFVDRVDILTRQALLQDWQAIRARLAPAPS